MTSEEQIEKLEEAREQVIEWLMIHRDQCINQETVPGSLMIAHAKSAQL